MAGPAPNRLNSYLPLLAFATVWSLQLLYFLGYQDRVFYTYGFGILNVILLTIFAYVVGFLGYKLVPVGKRDATREAPRIDDRAFGMLSRITLILSAFLIVMNIFVPLAQGISLSVARELVLEDWAEGSALTRIVAILANVTIAFSLMTVIDRIDQKRRFPILYVLLFILLTIAAYSRAHMLLGLSIISVKWLSRSRYKLSYILGIFILFAMLFSILSVVTSVGSADRGSGVEDMLRSMEIYTFGGVAGFDFYYSTGYPEYPSNLTIPRFVYSILSGLGNPPPSYFPFVDTTPPINIFSAIYPPYHDFGLVGVGGFFFIYGLVSAMVSDTFARTKSRYLCVFAGFVLYATLMSPFDDQFIRGLTTLILLMAGVILYTGIYRLYDRRKPA